MGSAAITGLDTTVAMSGGQMPPWREALCKSHARGHDAYLLLLLGPGPQVAAETDKRRACIFQHRLA